MHGTEEAVRRIGLPVAAGHERRPWFYNASGVSSATLSSVPIAWGPALYAHNAGAQVGGFVASYDVGHASTGLHLVIFRHAGHMVPAYAPVKAIHVLSRLVFGGAELAPPLPAGWQDATDFYSRNDTGAGVFADWVHAAMAAPFVT
jgi:hypothetical protein